MTSGERSGPQQEQSRQEAAEWWAAMHGPMSDSRREEFEAWLGSDSDNRGAYNRMGEIHALGKHLKDETDLSFATGSGPPHRATKRKYLVPIGFLASVLLLESLSYRQTTRPRLLRPVQDDTGSSAPFQRIATGTLSTRIGEIRRVSLSDGSWIILDTDSRVYVSLSAEVGLLRLDRGRARIEVGAGSRPLKLIVGDTNILASHAILDADRTNLAKVAIHVVSGAATIRNGTAAQDLPIALTTGQSLRIDPAKPTLKPVIEATSGWPTGAIDVNDMAVSNLVTAANRYSNVHILLGSPDLAALKVSGRFRINDTATLAKRLALLFDLRVDHPSDHELRLTPR